MNWRSFSLEEINRREGKKHPWERDWSYGWSTMRIGALLRLLEFPHVYEIQRAKAPSDRDDILQTLTPYLRAKDWVSINRGEVVKFPTPPSAADAR